MITKADIKQETNSVSYNRGKKIYESACFSGTGNGGYFRISTA